MLLISYFSPLLFSSLIHQFLLSTSLILAKHPPPDGNDDDCAACGGIGYLICCGGCSRSFHFTCCDPPLDKDENPDVFNCHVCLARMAPLDRPPPPRSGEKEPGVSKEPRTVIVYKEGGQTYDTTTRSSKKPVIIHNGGGRTCDTTTGSGAGTSGYYS